MFPDYVLAGIHAWKAYFLIYQIVSVLLCTEGKLDAHFESYNFNKEILLP